MSNFLNGRSVNARTITIASVFPRAKTAERDYSEQMSGGRTIFRLPAAAKGEVVTMTVRDCWELVETGEGTIGNMTRKPQLVPVESIVDCLLNQWTVNIAGTKNGHRPGIKAIAGDVPTAEELAELNQMQASYFDGLVNDANGFHAKHMWKSIDDSHRDAARWRGVDAPWLANTGETAERKRCAYCDEKIQSAAKFCVHCRLWQPGFEPVANAAVPVIERVENPKPGRPPIPPPVKSHSQAVA